MKISPGARISKSVVRVSSASLSTARGRKPALLAALVVAGCARDRAYLCLSPTGASSLVYQFRTSNVMSSTAVGDTLRQCKISLIKGYGTSSGTGQRYCCGIHQNTKIKPNTGVPVLINEQTWYRRYPMKRIVHVMRPVKANPASAADTCASVSPAKKKAGP